VILIDLKEDLTIGGILGKGNFARVHFCTVKEDITRKRYALKTIEKKQIKECKRNIVSNLG
jgi:hypothetical protein